MTVRMAAVVALVVLAWSAPSRADPWKDESGHGRYYGGSTDYYETGYCKVKRKWKHGHYRETVKCFDRPRQRTYRAPPAVVYLDPVPPPAALAPLPSEPSYGEPYRDDLGRYCREYQTTGVIDGRSERLYGRVCQQPDGSWAFAD